MNVCVPPSRGVRCIKEVGRARAMRQGGPGELPRRRRLGEGGENSAPSRHPGSTQPPPLPRRQVISLTFGKFDLEPDSYAATTRSASSTDP